MNNGKISDAKAITIYDIAKEAGVSPATVSRVLTNSANVRSEKKQKILELIDKYDFKPNVLAKGLVNTKTKTIGILAADIRNPYYAALFVACEKYAREIGYTVLLCNSLGNYETEKKLLMKLVEQRVDAVIQLGGQVDKLVSSEDYVELVNKVQSSIPMVITGKLDGTRCHVVRIDSMAAMEMVMAHLIGLGHKKIALIGGRKSVLATYEKHQRYKQILADNRIEYDQSLISDDGEYDYDTGYTKMAEMLDRGIVPTAVVAINDFSAMGVEKCLLERKYRIPEDIAVVSFDNTYMAEVSNPKLTSIDYNYDQYGRKLVDTAVTLIEGREEDNLVMINPTLMIRESSLKQ